MKQKYFFDIMGDKPRGQVWELASGNWKAIIDGGWWSATGTTKEGAIKSVKKMFKDETEKTL